MFMIACGILIVRCQTQFQSIPPQLLTYKTTMIVIKYHQKYWELPFQPSSAYHSLSYSDLNLTVKIYVCFHFAEIEKLTQGKKREFIINVNGGSYISEPITLDYLKSLSICLNQIFERQFSFVINATTGSDLPPILNAFELYAVIPQSDLHKPTNSRDGMYLYLIILFLFFFLKYLKVWD